MKCHGGAYVSEPVYPVFKNDFYYLADIYWAGSLTLRSIDPVYPRNYVIMIGHKFKLIQFTHYMQRSTHR